MRGPDDLPRTDDEIAVWLRDLGAPGLIDLHTHFLPPPVQRAVWDYFDALDDPPWPIEYRGDERQRLSLLRRVGVAACTALAYAHRPGMASWLNDYTLGLAAREADVIPTFTFHPEPSVEDDVDRALQRGGRVAKVHLQVGRFHADDPRLDGVWARLARDRVPVVIHAGAVYGVDGGDRYCGPDELRRLLDAHPDLVLVVAHLGAPDFDGFLRLAEQAPTLRLDTAMAPTDPPYPGLLRHWRADHGERVAALADRVVFGSDFPSIPHRYVAQVRGVGALPIADDRLVDVLHGNGRRLLDEARPDLVS